MAKIEFSDVDPERQGCPDEKTLKDIAENRLPADHPARLHLASCSPCFAEFRSFKGQFETKRASRRRILAWGISACLLVAVGLFGVKTIVKRSNGKVVTNQPQKPGEQLAAVDRTIDLFNHRTVRGGSDPNPLEAVSLPSTLVHLHLIIPRFSDAGSYVVAVSKDRAGTAIVARGTEKPEGTANGCSWMCRLIFEVLRRDRTSLPQCERVTTGRITIHLTCRTDEGWWSKRALILSGPETLLEDLALAEVAFRVPVFAEPVT